MIALWYTHIWFDILHLFRYYCHTSIYAFGLLYTGIGRWWIPIWVVNMSHRFKYIKNPAFGAFFHLNPFSLKCFFLRCILTKFLNAYIFTRLLDECPITIYQVEDGFCLCNPAIRQNRSPSSRWLFRGTPVYSGVLRCICDSTPVNCRVYAILHQCTRT